MWEQGGADTGRSHIYQTALRPRDTARREAAPWACDLGFSAQERRSGGGEGILALSSAAGQGWRLSQQEDDLRVLAMEG